jgi:hypothetical protein
MARLRGSSACAPTRPSRLSEGCRWVAMHRPDDHHAVARGGVRGFRQECQAFIWVLVHARRKVVCAVKVYRKMAQRRRERCSLLSLSGQS